jgi:hypothetical protein
MLAVKNGSVGGPGYPPAPSPPRRASRAAYGYEYGYEWYGYAYQGLWYCATMHNLRMRIIQQTNKLHLARTVQLADGSSTLQVFGTTNLHLQLAEYKSNLKLLSYLETQLVLMSFLVTLSFENIKPRYSSRQKHSK